MISYSEEIGLSTPYIISDSYTIELIDMSGPPMSMNMTIKVKVCEESQIVNVNTSGSEWLEVHTFDSGKLTLQVVSYSPTDQNIDIKGQYDPDRICEVSGLLNQISNILTIVTGIPSKIEDIISSISEIEFDYTLFVNPIVDKIDSLILDISDIPSGIIIDIKGYFDYIEAYIDYSIDWVLLTLKEDISTVISPLSDKIEGVRDDIKSYIDEVPDKVVDKIVEKIMNMEVKK